MTSNTILIDMMSAMEYMYVPMNLRIIYQSSVLMYRSGLSTPNTRRNLSLCAIHIAALRIHRVCLCIHRAACSRWRIRFMFFLFILLKLNSSSEIVYDAAFPLHEVALLDVLACVGDESQIEGEVVNACYLHCQKFLGLEEMVQISL